MGRLLGAVTLSMWIVLLGSLSYGIGDYQYIFENWFISFSLPLWSILMVGFWYDIGRLLIGTTVDSPDSKKPLWLRSLLFVGWMSVVFTYIVWAHIELQLTQMLITIPLLAIPLNRFLIQDWGKLEVPTPKELFTIFLWSISSYFCYWIITFAWILARIQWVEVVMNGSVYIIQ